jgi:tetratricopeptide (TPR) repeat protein
METHLNTLKRSPTGLSAIARVHAHQGNPDRAIVALTRALDAGPIDLRCRELLARMYVNRQDYEHAYELYRNLITRRPTHIPYYLSLGNAYRKEGDLMESLTILQEARQIAPGHDGVYNSLGHTYFELAWYDKAASAFEKALAIRSSPQALINLAVVALKNGNAAKADSIFGTISHRRISSALTNTANLRMRAGDYKKAASLYKKALHKDGSNWKILYNLSLAHQAQGKYKKARTYLRTLQKLQPDNIEVHMLSAQVEEKLGHLQDASGHYEKILSQSPANQQALSAMCDLLVEQGKEKEAVAHLEKYLEYAPENVDILLRIAEIYIRMGWYQVATAKYENIVADHPQHPRAYLGWAQAIYRNLKEKNRGDWHAAVQLAQKAGQLTDENNPHVHILLGKLYLYNNDTSRARTHLRTAQTAAGDEPHLKKEIDHLLQHAL